MADYGIDEILTAKALVNLRILGGFPIYVDRGVDGFFSLVLVLTLLNRLRLNNIECVLFLYLCYLYLIEGIVYV
jgi:hypothetical protein